MRGKDGKTGERVRNSLKTYFHDSVFFQFHLTLIRDTRQEKNYTLPLFSIDFSYVFVTHTFKRTIIEVGTIDFYRAIPVIVQ